MKTKEITGKTRLVGFFATPSKHSISPMIHNTGFALQNIDAIYLAFDVGKLQLPQSIEMIKTWNMLGANISMPNKTLAIDYMDELSESATLIGSINTIVHQKGKLVGHNTDGIGFMRSVDHLSLIGHKITILGTGGAALAIIAQAALDGIKEIAVYNRKSPSNEAAKKKIAVIAKHTQCSIYLADLADEKNLAKDIAESKLLVNATSVGMEPNSQESLIKHPEIIVPNIVVSDIIYNPKETLLLQQAKQQGALITNGIDMLLYQGAEAFKLFTGKELPVEKIKPRLKLFK